MIQYYTPPVTTSTCRLSSRLPPFLRVPAIPGRSFLLFQSLALFSALPNKDLRRTELPRHLVYPLVTRTLMSSPFSLLNRCPL